MYPYHIGRQKGTIKPKQPTGLTLNRTLLTEKLQELGYSTHIVGKWHLGRVDFWIPVIRHNSDWLDIKLKKISYKNNMLLLWH